MSFSKNTQLFMNASSNVSNVEIANKIASTAALFRKYFPDASVNFSPWDNSNNESMQDTIDFAFHFLVGVLLLNVEQYSLQLRIENDNNDRVPKLLGIIMRGMIVPSERWRVATIGDWEMTGLIYRKRNKKITFFWFVKNFISYSLQHPLVTKISCFMYFPCRLNTLTKIIQNIWQSLLQDN